MKDARAFTRIDLMRHGEPVGGSRIRGQSDDPLSDLGWRQMAQAVGVERPWRSVVTSPLQRCEAFARALAQEVGIALRIEARFKERSYGRWEGRSKQDIEREAPDLWARHAQDPQRYSPPDAEPIPQFYARVVSAWEELVASCAEQHVLVVCHAGVIRALITHILGAPPEHMFRIDVPYAGITRVRIEGDRPPVLVAHGRGAS